MMIYDVVALLVQKIVVEDGLNDIVAIFLFRHVASITNDGMDN
jgi:hypothetical protein